ncbi:MAG: selenocysteine lyase, PLP-dependent [Pseudomonadota bacterium]|jgi:cysteine desulfurase/selenocysteine lyase
MSEALRLVSDETRKETGDAAVFAKLRASFPILSRTVNGCPLVYCDSAATSLTPNEVIDAEADYYRTIGANVHRGSHALAVEASEAYEGARSTVAAFIGARTREVVFTANATAALNLVAAGLYLSADAEVLATNNEHHSALLPFMKRGRLRTFVAAADRPLDPAEVLAQIGPRTRAIVIAHASNVTGIVHPVREICCVARELGVLTIVDAAQSAPHLPLDVRDLGCDFLAFSGHKLLGPTGIGVLYGRAEVLAALTPRDIGGGTVERATATSYQWNAAPHSLEPGTPNIAGALGLAEATRFLERIGWDALTRHAEVLTRAAFRGLSAVPGVSFVSSPEHTSLPTLSLTFPGYPIGVDVVAATLSDRYGIMVRSGLHCAHPLFQQLALRDGALRASFYVYNTLDDVDALCAGLTDILSVFR